jgi:ubiquinone biosynthesis protein COQ9
MANGLSPSAVGMFGQGAYDLVNFAMRRWYDQLKIELDELDMNKLGLIGRLKTGIKTRLSYQIPFMKYWPSAMALGLHPYHIGNTLYRIHKISDHLWYVAGDNSVDANWYTKRVALSTVFTTTELYMVQDNSKDYRDTWEFLDNRLNNMVSAGSISESLQNNFIVASKGILSMASAFFPESSFKAKADEFEKAKKQYKDKPSKKSPPKETTSVEVPKEGEKGYTMVIEAEEPEHLKEIPEKSSKKK